MPFGNYASRRVAIIGGIRLPFCRVGTAYEDLSNLQLMSACLKALVQKYSLQGKLLGDVALGATINHPQEWNLARDAVLESGLALETPGVGIQRACGTSLETAIAVAGKISTGQIDVGIAGGVDSASDTPIFYRRPLAHRVMKTARGKNLLERVKPWLWTWPTEFLPGYPAIAELRTGKTMGEHCEMMAQEWKISREAQDELALKSHQNAAAAYAKGFYDDLVAEFRGLKRDNIVRGDTSLEKLARLKPAFDFSGRGTLTAGNSTPLTDGAACVLMASEAWAQQNGFEVQAYMTDAEVAAVDFSDEGLLMAPTYAVSRLLERQNLRLQDFDHYEIHEAFAAQVLCTLKAWEDEDFCRERLKRPQALGAVDRSKMNVCGGSVALGHPFGATGSRLVATLGKILQGKGTGRGLISICTGGGMGVAAIFER